MLFKLLIGPKGILTEQSALLTEFQLKQNQKLTTGVLVLVVIRQSSLSNFFILFAIFFEWRPFVIGFEIKENYFCSIIIN